MNAYIITIMNIITTTISIISSLYPEYDGSNGNTDTRDPFINSKILFNILDNKFTYYNNKWFKNNNSFLERVEIEEDYVYYYIFYDYLSQLKQYLTNNEKYNHIQIRPCHDSNRRHIVNEWYYNDRTTNKINNITNKEKLEIELRQKNSKIIQNMISIIRGFYTKDNIDILFKNLKVLYKYN